MELALLSDWKRHPCEEPQLEEIFAKEYHRLGHRVHVAALIPDLRESFREEVWHGQPLTLIRREAAGLPRLWRWLGELARGGSLDFIQVRNDPLFAAMAAARAKAAGIPWVYHLSVLNGPVLIAEARQKKTLPAAVSLAKGLIGGKLVDRAALSCDLLLPISTAMAVHYERLGRTKPTFALPMGCRAAAYEPEAPGEAIEALYVGSLDRVRGLDFLLRAFAIAWSKQPNLRLTFLGSSRDPNDRSRLEQTAREMGLVAAVAFEAPILRGQIPSRIRKSHIGVSPVPPTPYYLLSSPTKLMECLGAGRPAVGNDLPEQEAVLKASKGGFCVPYEEQAFAEALATLAQDARLRATMGQSAAAYMAAHRDYSLLAAGLEAAYRRHLFI